MDNIVITGGAGFLGTATALKLKELYPGSNIVALDNLKRRGSELNLARLQSHGVRFIHADIRSDEDLQVPADLIVECSAEPSVLAGRDGDSRYLLNTNLVGAMNCFELARRQGASVIFVSSSRVYPFDRINDLPFVVQSDRFVLQDDVDLPAGISTNGIDTDFPLPGIRTLYGASKLSAELILQEYADVFNVPAVIFRFGVIAGPWQMGKVDQGFVALWVARHMMGQPLSYIGFGGQGHQVRDILHVDDASALIGKAAQQIGEFCGDIFNAGGGSTVSGSLAEVTNICRQETGRDIEITKVTDTRPGDIPWYISDNRIVSERFSWTPTQSVGAIVADIADWLRRDPTTLKRIFG